MLLFLFHRSYKNGCRAAGFGVAGRWDSAWRGGWAGRPPLCLGGAGRGGARTSAQGHGSWTLDPRPEGTHARRSRSLSSRRRISAATGHKLGRVREHLCDCACVRLRMSATASASAGGLCLLSPQEEGPRALFSCDLFFYFRQMSPTSPRGGLRVSRLWPPCPLLHPELLPGSKQPLAARDRPAHVLGAFCAL